MAKRRINVRGIIYKNGALLAQQLKPCSDGVERNYWCTPGGGLDECESLHQGLAREIVEETGIIPTVGKLLFIQQFHDGKKEQLEFFFHITNAKDYENIDLAETLHGTREIKQVEFIDPKKHDIMPVFLQTINIQDYIENDRPVFIYNELIN
jgi:ADP-ribose pyrophosphatase YjhB (NUDIX family)